MRTSVNSLASALLYTLLWSAIAEHKILTQAATMGPGQDPAGAAAGVPGAAPPPAQPLPELSTQSLPYGDFSRSLASQGQASAAASAAGAGQGASLAGDGAVPAGGATAGSEGASAGDGAAGDSGTSEESSGAVVYNGSGELVSGSNSFGDASTTYTGPQSWPELVGQNVLLAKARLVAQTGLHIFLVPQGSAVTDDYRADRIRIFYDPATYTVTAPAPAVG